MDNLKGKLFRATKNISQTSGQFLQSTKLSISITNEEENLKSLYVEIGKKVHEIYMFGGTLGSFFDDKYKEIQELEGKMSLLRDQLDSVKGTKTCPKCNKAVDKNAEFCPKCGQKMSDKPIIDMDTIDVPSIVQDSEAIVTTDSKICSVCRTKNDVNQKFCSGCGRFLS